MKRLLAVALLAAGLLAGCSSGPNLAQDQAAVNQLTTQLHDDRISLNYQIAMDDQCIRKCDEWTAVIPILKQDVVDDTFKLKVAQDQLTKDEG